MRIVRLCLLSLAVLSFGAGAQPLYKWVDKNGKVHYSDQPPPKEIKKVDKPRLGGSFIETSEIPFSVQKAAQDFPVTLYTAADCKADCDIARAFLRKRGIPFAEKSLASEEDVASFKKLFNSDGLYFPSLTVGSQKQQGFEEQTWHGLLDNAGYPRTAIPGAAPAASSEPAPAAQ
jgi:hypothetical protein